jgi:asparagine synthase (glutamine-hydrolysing)
MSGFVAHRGPDGEGYYVEKEVGLGHRRLAIIDLSPLGRQPMTRDSTGAVIAYNGEIYNFREIRAELESCGDRFRSRSDTEVILAAYERWGIDFLAKLRGMFALAIWDPRNRSLVLARDRLGKKPLYYLLDANGIAFASESKAFLADPDFRAVPDPVALSHYLTYQYVPSPFSAFSGVRKVPPAHYLLVRADGSVVEERYWKLSYVPKRRVSEADACEELLSKLREAVKLRLISDVPIGAFLSGGLDSSAVVALMAEESASPVKTFSIGFAEKDFDELHFARLVAQRYGTDHHEFVVRPDAKEIFPKLIWHYGEPFADSSAIPTYYLAQLTRQYVTVALNGDGGDENFAGYDRYVANALSRQYEWLPREARVMLAQASRMIPESGGSRSLIRRGKRFLRAIGDPPERRYTRWVSHFDADLKAELCTEEFRKQAEHADSEALLLEQFQESDAPDFVDETLDVDVNTYLPDDLLVKVDVATMAHGLEARSPLLDHVFMEFCASLPSDFKLRGRTTKYIFKRAVRDLLPTEIPDRRKMGFGVPLVHWLRTDLRDFAVDLLLSERASARGYFNMKVVERLLSEHASGRRNWHYQLWNLLVLEMWHRVFIDESAVRGREFDPQVGGLPLAELI